MVKDDFNKMVEELQKKIEFEEEKSYSKVVIKEYRNPIYFGVIRKPDAVGQVTGSCNDTMKITLTVKNGLISNGRFWTDGCGATIACGNMLMKMVREKSIMEAKSISKKDLLNTLEGLPKEHMHCAKLAIDTLYSALNKLYQKR